MIFVLCPSRGRPLQAREAYEAFLSTRKSLATSMYFIVDDDDTTKDAYEALLMPVVSYGKGHGSGMGRPVNAAARDLAPKCDIIGFVGDDHRFRTDGWDLTIRKTLVEKPGFAYANDKIRSDIPTQVFITSKIVQDLGWMCLPGARHLYLDDTWRYLANGADCLTYLPDVIIEHLHPTVGTNSWDEGYRRVNHPDVYSHDGQLYQAWVDSGQADKDVETVKQAILR